MRTRLYWLSVVALLVSFVGAAATAFGAPNEVKITELAPGVFFRKAQTEPKFTGCNQGWVVFNDYVLVIDANFPGQAEEVIKVIRKYTDKPIRFVFDTHYHGDHADGNMQYLQQGASVVAHERSQPLFQTKGIDGFTGAQKDANRKEEYGPLQYVIPSLYFSHKLIFDDGEQRVELMFLGHAHTAGDAVAWLPKHGILFTGDACVNGAFNYTGDSNTESWIAVLGAMSELGVKQVAPGHGELAGTELIATQKRYFTELRASIRAAIGKGRTLDQIKQEIDLPFYKEWTGVEAKTRVENIEFVYKEISTAKRPLSSNREFRMWQALPGAGDYARLAAWDQLGKCDADRRWSSLADLFLAATTTQRKEIRDYFANRRDLDDMWMYVRRMGVRLTSPDDVDWLRRGLAIAAIDGGRRDYRDTIVSLVLLRHGAERVGMKPDTMYLEIQQPEFVIPENRYLFENARTHSAANVAATILAFGPAAWQRELPDGAVPEVGSKDPTQREQRAAGAVQVGGTGISTSNVGQKSQPTAASSDEIKPSTASNALTTAATLTGFQVQDKPRAGGSKATFVYVSMAPEQKIQLYRLNLDNGQLTAVDTLAVEGAPGCLSVDPQQKFLFASLRTNSTLASYRIDSSTGKLTHLSTAALPANENAAFVRPDRSGRWLLSASYAAGRVVVHRLTDAGAIESPSIQTIDTTKTAHCIAIDRENRFVFVPHVAPNAVYQFRLDASTGKLTEAGKAPGGAEKAGPRHLAFHPTQNLAFTSDESGSSITAYRYDPASGLKPVQTLSTLPADFTGQNSTAEVKVHPNGKFVWVSNRGHDSLAAFAIDAEGKLTARGQTPTEKTPRSFDIDPSGRYAFGAGEGSGKLAVFQVNPDSGQLTRIQTYDIGKSLSWVLAVEF